MTDLHDLQFPVFAREFTPTWLAACGHLNGVRALPHADMIFFGAASGLTAAVVAAVHPDATVCVLDNDLTQLTKVQAWATAARLENLHAIEADSAWVPRTPLPDRRFGFAGLIDVMFTRPDDEMNTVLDLASTCLAPGALVGVTMRTSAVWAGLAPLRSLILLLDELWGPMTAPETADRLRHWRSCGVRYLERAASQRTMEALEHPTRGAYTLGVLRDPHWRYASFADLSNRLAQHGMTHIDSLHPGDRAALGVNRALAALIADCLDPTLREVVRDAALVRPYRVDLFGRGALEAAEPELPLVDRLRMVSVNPEPISASGSEGMLTSQPLADAQLSGVRAEEPTHPEDIDAVRAALQGGQVHPLRWGASPPGPDQRAPSERLNRLLEDGGHQLRSVPMTGSALDLPLLAPDTDVAP